MWVILSCAALFLAEEQLFDHNLFKYSLTYVLICGVHVYGVFLRCYDDRSFTRKKQILALLQRVIQSCFRATLEMYTCF